MTKLEKLGDMISALFRAGYTEDEIIELFQIDKEVFDTITKK